MLRLVEGLTGPEIAQRTGLTPASVRVNLHRGMGLLPRRLARKPAMKKTDDDSYLWDGSGEPDPEVVRLETLLGSVAAPGVLPALPRQRSRSATCAAIGALSAAAAVLIVAAVAWLVLRTGARGWRVQTIAGAPVVDGVQSGLRGHPASPSRYWRMARDRRDVPRPHQPSRRSAGWTWNRIPGCNCWKRAAANTAWRSREGQSTRASGRLRNSSSSTRQAPLRSISDASTRCKWTMGVPACCVYSGWVGLDGNGREAFIPEGAVGATRPGVGPGTPYYEDAPAGYGEALGDSGFRCGGPDAAGCRARPDTVDRASAGRA